MESPSPTVSVVIPTHNRRERLEQAIASCFEGNETLDLEVIVVDDGSTDDTQPWMEAIEDERVRYIRQKNRGAQAARNRGMRQAKGRFIKFLDDDDRLPPGALTREVETLEAQGAAISCGHLHVKGPENEFVFHQNPKPDLISGIFRGSAWTHLHAFLYRATALRTCRWEEDVPYHQDTAFAVQAMAQGLPEASVDRIVGIYHDHDGVNISNNRKSQASPVDRAQLQVEFIESGVHHLRESGSLKDHHLEAAVEGMWRWAHIIAGYDLTAFSDVYGRITSLQSDFAPSRRTGFLSGLDSIIGARRTEQVLFPVRRIKRALASRDDND